MIDLVLRFQTVTPLFLGNAEQQAELRPASIKGALRWWYRAIDPAFANPDLPDREIDEKRDRPLRLPLREDLLFGGTQDGAGQSRCLIRVPPKHFQRFTWDEDWVRQFNEGRGVETQNGLKYFGYPFSMKGNLDRTAVAAGEQFEVQSLIPRVPGREIHRRGILAAWWLLGTLGSLGTRSRRGFGSLTLLDWDARPMGDDLSAAAWEEDLQSLPLAAQAARPEGWRAAVKSGLETCKQWFGDRFDDAEHPHIEHPLQFRLLDDAFQGDAGWAEAMDHAGKLMQAFRAARREPDYSAIRDYTPRNEPLKYAPDRSTFGLPLAFRSGPVIVPSGRDRDAADFERHASLLLVKVVRIGSAFHPLFVRMSGAVPGMSPGGTIRSGRSGRSGTSLQPARHNLMDEFLNSLDAGDPAVFRPEPKPPAHEPRPDDRVEAELLAEKTKKGGWKARDVLTGESGPIVNSADVPGDKQPGDKLTLIVSAWSPQLKQFKYPAAGDDQVDRQREPKEHGKPRGGRGPRR